MASGIEVASLFAGLKVKIDPKSFEAANKMLGLVKTGLGALAAYASVNFVKGLVDQTVELGGHIADLSQQIGVAAEPLQQLGYAAQLSGSSMQGMGVALRFLSRNAFAAQQGGKEQAKTFRELGVSVKDAHGALRPVEDILGDVAEKIASMPDGTEKTALAMRAFGRSGAELIPLLNEGRDGIAALRKEFVELGGQISEKDVQALEAFGDEQDKVKVAMQGLKNEVVIALLPALREMVTSFVEWFKANRQIIRQRLETFFRLLVSAAGLVVKALGAVVAAANWLYERQGLLITGVAALTTAFILLRAGAIASAVATAAAWVAAAAPFILLTAIIGGVILVIEDLYHWITGGESVLREFYEDVEFFIGQGATKIWNDAVNAWTDTFGEFSDYVLGSLASIGESVADVLWDFVHGYDTAGNMKKLREEGKARGLKGAELDAFVKNGVDNQITGDPDRVRAEAAARAKANQISALQRGAYSLRTATANGTAVANVGAAVGASITNAPSMSVALTINAGSADPNEIGKTVNQQLTEFWDSKIRNAMRGLGR